jgi:hypothetical protein
MAGKKIEGIIEWRKINRWQRRRLKKSLNLDFCSRIGGIFDINNLIYNSFKSLRTFKFV